MVKIDIEPEEAKAFINLFNDASCPPAMGYALTMLRAKIESAFKKAQAKQAQVDSDYIGKGKSKKEK